MPSDHREVLERFMMTGFHISVPMTGGLCDITPDHNEVFAAIGFLLAENERLRAERDKWEADAIQKLNDYKCAMIDKNRLQGDAIAWAVLCADGQVHEFEEWCGLFLADDQARDECEILNDDPDDLRACGPHTVAALALRGGDEIT